MYLKLLSLCEMYTVCQRTHILLNYTFHACNITAVFSRSNWKILHLAKFFTQPAVVMVVTNMRCGYNVGDHEIGFNNQVLNVWLVHKHMAWWRSIVHCKGSTTKLTSCCWDGEKRTWGLWEGCKEMKGPFRGFYAT